ncbi:MAG TPA: SPOR domain-containing protein [Pseudorhizobium sp.]|nr:SPOR domain-containing protein [Pseudorhizobium sp.]
MSTSAAKPVASPALRSLATPTLPREPQPEDRRVTSADEAILAAAEATGAEIGWVDAPEEPVAAPPRGPRLRRPRMPRSFGFSRAVAGPLVAVSLLVVAGGGLYWVLGTGGDAGPVPLLTADASPVKEMPAVETASAATPQSVVFNEIEGVPPSADEQLVSRDQADVDEVTQVATPDVSAEGLANRKVRTVTVRPDGTIVSGDESLAGSTMLPVDRPNVPEVPGAQMASPALLASTETATGTLTTTGDTEPVDAPTAETPVPEEAVAVAPVEPGTIVPAVDPSGNPIAGRTAPVPATRPTNLAQVATPSPFTPPAPTSPVNAVFDPLPDTASVAPQQPASGDTAPAYVQLASQRTEQDALATANQLVSRFGPIFNGANMEIQRADLGTRGIYYRVRVPASSMQQAAEMCNNVKAQGGDCVAM